MPTRPVKIAVLGGGYGAKVPLPVLSDMEEFEPVAVWSRRRERARELAEKHALELGTNDVDELLAHPDLEAVHVATPVATHAEVATAAARRGLHVLVDKPVAMDLGEARAVRDAVDEAGVVCAVNYGRRFQAARARLLERVAEVAGAPRMVSISLVFDDHALPESRPFTWVQDAALGGGRLQGYGVHDLDLLLAAFGEVDSVAAATEVGVGEREAPDGTPHTVTAEDAYVILIRFRGGGLGHVSLTATARHKRGDVIEVHGADGTVRLDADKRLHWGRAGEELQVEGPLQADSKAAYTHVARSFHAAIREGAAPEPGLDEGLRVQALFDAIRRADAERRWVQPEAV
ncbi:MAG TPA: Gfo/Idh/MocA family oxidoreductase [Solirubrobacteraceae bacterium]|nr:Gfo/Idh/MocA family oxidoreductase [Solirubrobacteraceae bacterium]